MQNGCACRDPERSRGFLYGQEICLTVAIVDDVQPDCNVKIIETGKKQPFYFHRIVGRFIGKVELNGKTGAGS